MTIEMRDADPEEYAEVSALLAAAWEEYRPSRERRSDEGKRVFDEYMASVPDVWSRLEDSMLIVAIDDGRIVGTVTYYPPRPLDHDEGWPGWWAAMRLLGVHPDARCRGIGRALTEECLRRAREDRARTFGLHTSDIMEVARGMYERMGFYRVAEYDFHPSPDITVWAYRYDFR